ncbi:MAG: ABC-type lipoprotein export system ATPase subunit [Planctomycetaceae bacterium]|jgi:ABC-type lipoprotein export system ATPase subunit
MNTTSEELAASEMACPQCRTRVSMDASECIHCGLALEWIARFPEFQQALSVTDPDEPLVGQPPAIERTPLRPTPLSAERATTLGRSSESTLPVHHSSVEFQHCVFVRQPVTGDYWLADRGAGGGTWLNRQRIASARLADGDLIQAGRFAWAFNTADGYLVPVDAIDGVRVDLRSGVGLSDRLGPLADVEIPTGQFVAITGSSGAGKSTLLKAIAGLPGSRDSGLIAVDGQNIGDFADWFRSVLGYVSQNEFLPDRLSARQAVQFSGRLRGEAADNVDAILLQMGLPRDRWDASIRKLSGGQALRVRTAAELISSPRLLLLDEPGSGLDLQREQHLMKLLRMLSWRGCTIIIVSHNREAVAICDRVLQIERDESSGAGTIVSDGPPGPTMTCHPAVDVRFASSSTFEESSCARPSANEPVETGGHAIKSTTFRMQCWLLMQREFLLVRQDWNRRLLVPLLIMPAVFALTLGTAVSPTADDLLAFFSVLSGIWMGGSLSLMQIVGDRDVYDHERHLFLRTSSYVLAKAAMLQMLATVQVSVFVILLNVVRAMMDFDGLPSPGWTTLSLLPVAWTGVGLGLLLSALARHNKELAGFLWPLVMIAQIVFSVPVCVGSEKTLSTAYGEFLCSDN